MSRPEASVASPCTNVCRMDAAGGWCEGCWRTLDEIVAWGTLDDAARRAVLARLPQRRAAQPVPVQPLGRAR